MIFPHDVYAKTKRGSHMTDADKAKIVIGVLFMLVVGLVLMLNNFLRELGIPLAIVIIAALVLWLFLSVQVFRFMIFREQDRDVDESDHFLPYYKFRPGSAKIESPVGKYDMYELKNNSFVSVLMLRLGRNNTQKAEYTQQFFDKIQDLLHEKRLKFSLVAMKENFIESEEATKMLKNVNAVTESQLRVHLLKIYNEVFSFAETYGTVMCFYLMVSASSSMMKEELEDAMVQIVSMFNKGKNLHALRSVDFLDQKGMFNFFRRFYGVDAIDLSLSKVQFNTTDSSVLESIAVYRIISKSGKSYCNSIMEKMSTGVKFFGKIE